MNANQFFLQQYGDVQSMINEFALKGLTDEQMPCPPEDGLNSLVWLVWHTARCQDFAMRIGGAQNEQLLDEDWLERMNIGRRDLGAGMTPEECAAFNAQVDVDGVRAYWAAVRQRVKTVACLLPPAEWETAPEDGRLQEAFADGAIGSERARWLESFFTGKTRAWWLSFTVWHSAVNLLRDATCVRRLKGIPSGL